MTFIHYKLNKCTYNIAVRSLGTAAAGAAAYLLLKFVLGFGQPALDAPLAMLNLPPTTNSVID